MKRFTLILLVFWLISVFVIAETPAEYYLPLQVGNRLVYRAGEEGSSWSPRTVYETIEGTDSLFGKPFYKQVGSEFMDDNPTDEHVFHVFWLREDTSGTIMIGALGSGESRDLDSATVYTYEFPFFHEGFIEPGYCLDTVYLWTRYRDSTLSATETVETGAGTFYNCIKREQLRWDFTGNITWHEYHWFAKDVGMVKLQRVTPDPHINNLTQINFQTRINNSYPNSCVLNQNYPNPFNPLTVIDYSISKDCRACIKIYDIMGHEKLTLAESRHLPGTYKAVVRSHDLPSGVYVYTLEIDNSVVDHKKMCILK